MSETTVDILLGAAVLILLLCVYVYRIGKRGDADRWRESNYFGDRK